MISNSQIVDLFRKVAAAYTIKKVNRFRIIAYENAADNIEQLTEQLYDLWKQARLNEVAGLGDTLRENLDELFRSQRSKNIDDALSGISPAVFELMKVPGIGPLKAHRLCNQFNLSDEKSAAEQLFMHAQNGEVAVLDGFGKKSEESLLVAIAQYQKTRSLPQRIPYGQAHALAQDIIAYLKKNTNVKRIDTLGSLRRHELTIGDIDIAVAVAKDNEAKVLSYFLKYSKIDSVINSGDTKASIRVLPNIRVDFRVQDEKTYGSMLQYFTGSKAHNILLREHTLSRGFSLNEYGLKTVDHPERPLKVFATEERLYGFLGLRYVPPEQRKGTDEIENAKI